MTFVPVSSFGLPRPEGRDELIAIKIYDNRELPADAFQATLHGEMLGEVIGNLVPWGDIEAFAHSNRPVELFGRGCPIDDDEVVVFRVACP